MSIIDRKTPAREAFQIVDDVLRQGVQGVSDLITRHDLINADFNDAKKVMANSGSALMGIGVASGDDRALEAAKQAINSPLLDVSIEGAKGVLLNMRGGEDMAMAEIAEAASIITQHVDRDANIIFGMGYDEVGELKKGEIKVTVIATGFTGGFQPTHPTIANQASRASAADISFFGEIPRAHNRLALSSHRFPHRNLHNLKIFRRNSRPAILSPTHRLPRITISISLRSSAAR